jgi:hypothetical protein
MEKAEYQKRYYEKNKEKFCLCSKQRRERINSDPSLVEERREYARNYYKLHVDKDKEKEKRKINWKKIKNNPELKEKYKKNVNLWRATPSGIYTSLKNRKRHDFNLGKEEFIKWYDKQKKKCIYCGLTIEEIRKLPFPYNRKNGKNKYSIDRKDNTKGYFLDNIVLCCFTCNTIKNNFLSYEEMIKIGKEILGPKLRKVLESQT